MTLITDSKDISRSLHQHRKSIHNPTTEEYLQELSEKYTCSISTVVTKSNLSKSFTYQIFNGTRMAGRDVLIRIAFAIGINLEETQKLLRVAGKGQLYPKVRRDAAIIYSLHHKYDLYGVSEVLEQVGERPLL